MMLAQLEREDAQVFLEYAAIGNGRVDRSANVVRGVKIVGTSSRNRREYPIDTLRQAIPMYEGAKVYFDHQSNSRSNDPRGYAEQFGTLRGIRAEADGLYGDLHYNPKHRLAEQFAYDAEHSPNSVGLSHNIMAESGVNASGTTVAKKIRKVQSVDLVTDPATTGGLFESVGGQRVNLDVQQIDLRRDRYKNSPISYSLREGYQVLPDKMSSTGPSEAAKVEYRQYVLDAATKGTSPSESDLGKCLALVNKTLDDFRKDVADLKRYLTQAGIAPSPHVLESTGASEFHCLKYAY
jgi:hypothetical protein